MNCAGSYSNILFCFILVAEEMDQRPEMRPMITKRMVKAAEKALDPPASKVPTFLEHCSKSGKRSRNTNGSIKTPFIPNWGICEQDSVLGSPAMALDWAKCSITPPDLLAVTATDKLEESEMLGAQALYQVTHVLSEFSVSSYV